MFRTSKFLPSLVEALFYGIQISDSALMTCMVFDRKDRHLHFVDGASGGYALAAKQMKGQLAENRKYG